ncbi:uncharacterized protein Dwil_GK27695 [Drosophila willistoni]|uniref:SCP domain-containing protein n=1 Tax=Drosophila willistoni TaxID=7260 RepID=A0A0Q9WST8_DROWI|nr:uncharacterized protein Dwil_GK27695 [Drosophila willistoni]
MIPGVFAGFAEDMLSEHNRLRKLHGSPDLQLAEVKQFDEIGVVAKLIAESGEEPSYDRSTGASTCKTLEKPVNCAQQWYDEIKDYDFNNPGFSDKTKYFTALIWKSSTKLRVATAHNATNKYNYVVASYEPLGNIDGQFKENVPRRNGSPLR